MNLYVTFLSFLICFLFNYSNSACMEESSSPNSSSLRPRLNLSIHQSRSLVRQSLCKRLNMEEGQPMEEEQFMDVRDTFVLSRTSSQDFLNEGVSELPAQAALLSIASGPSLRKGCSFDRSVMSAMATQLPPPEDVPMEDASVEVAPLRVIEIYVKRAGDPLEGNSKMVILEGSFAREAHRVYHKQEKLKRKEQSLLLFNDTNRPGSASPKNRRPTKDQQSKKSFTP